MLAVGESLISGQAKIRLVDQGRRVERIHRRFICQPGGRQFAELLVNQGEKFGRGPCPTLIHCIKQLRDRNGHLNTENNLVDEGLEDATG